MPNKPCLLQTDHFTTCPIISYRYTVDISLYLESHTAQQNVRVHKIDQFL